jgi:hypothetical protein
MSATSGIDTATQATPAPGELTVGQLADRIAVAWKGVKTYRTTFQTIPPSDASPIASPIASPVAVPPAFTAVDEVVLPDRRHYAQLSDGRPVMELILADGVVYARGVVVPGATPTAETLPWVTLDPAKLDAGSLYRTLFDRMTAPITPPYSGLSTAERERIARPAGAITVGDRTCQAYRIADTTMTGERIEVVLAIGADDLPCSIETRVASSDSITTFEYNLPITIAAPR